MRSPFRSPDRVLLSGVWRICEFAAGINFRTSTENAKCPPHGLPAQIIEPDDRAISHYLLLRSSTAMKASKEHGVKWFRCAVMRSMSPGERPERAHSRQVTLAWTVTLRPSAGLVVALVLVQDNRRNEINKNKTSERTINDHSK